MDHVAYYRVSTDQQGTSGLGIDAQRQAVQSFININGNKLVAEYVEVESGRKADRPVLAQALAECRKRKAKLVIAKLDRLARNASFLLALRDSGVDFICADMPEANRLTIGILALVAEDEADRISARTKAALAAKRARGEQLGNLASLPTARANSIRTRQANTAAHRREIMAAVVEIQAAGLTSYTAIAGALNARGIKTRRGGVWHPASVRRIMLEEEN